MRFRQRPSQHGEILGEHVHLAAIDFAISRDHAIAQKPLLVESKVRGPVGDQLAQFLESPGIQQKLDAFTGGQFAFAMLGFDARLTPS